MFVLNQGTRAVADHRVRAACRRVFLAHDGGGPRTAAEIAGAAHVPPGYLAKVLRQLARAGVVSPQRGLGGGFALTREPRDVSVLEVVQAVDPLRRIRSCPLGLPEHRRALCALHRALDDAYAVIEASFRDTSLAQLATPPRRSAAPPAWPAAVRRRRQPRSG
jgi:Rrf2 family protein